MALPRLACLPLILCLLAGCVEHPPHREEGTHALLFSWTPILSVNGQPPEDAYRSLLLPGDYRLEVLYRSYRQDYQCRFELRAEAGRTYEVVDHSNDQPLVLYRYVRANSAWVERRDPVMPRCEPIPREASQP